MDFPLFDGRTPLSKEVLNELIRKAKSNSKFAVGPGLNMFDMGSLGKVITPAQPVPVAGETTISTKSPYFWARVYITPADGTDPGNKPNELPPGMDKEPDPPAAYIVEQMSDSNADSAGFTDLLGGRRAWLEDLNFLFQHVGSLSNFGPGTAFGGNVYGNLTAAFGNSFSLKNYTSGTFTLEFKFSSYAYSNLGDLGTVTTGPIEWRPDVDKINKAIDDLDDHDVPKEIDKFEARLLASGNTPPIEGYVGEGFAFGIIVTAKEPARPIRTDIKVNADNLTKGDKGAASSVFIARSVGSANTKMLNLNPHGQLVFVNEVPDANDVNHYLFDLPFLGMWGKIIAPAYPDSDPPAYPFNEVAPVAFLPSLIEYVGGASGYAFEINGETGVAVGDLVWLIPIFVQGQGWMWIFTMPNDMRILRYTGETHDPNTGQIQIPNCTVVGGPSPGVAQMVPPDGGTSEYKVGAYYYGQRAGSTDIYPRYITPDRIGTF